MPLTPQQRTRLSLSLQRVSRKIEKMLKQETGAEVAFSLIIWGAFGEDHMIQYVANAARKECAEYIGELLASWKAGMPNIPFHERN